jgi:hypothetical protein
MSKFVATTTKQQTMRTVFKLPLIGILFFFSSCASVYHPVFPETVQFNPLDTSTTLSYKYNVLEGAGNHKLARKEAKSPIRVIAIKLTNNTGKTLLYGINYKLYSGTEEIPVLPADSVETVIQQTSSSYLLYLLMTPITVTVTKNSIVVNRIPVGLVLGPVIALANMGISANANKNFLADLRKNTLAGKPVKNGEVLYAMIGITTDVELPSLNIKLL